MADTRLPVGLTRLGFRRDVRLFLGVLVGFLSDSLQRTREAVNDQWESAADSVADEMSAAVDLTDLQARLNLAMSRHVISGVRIAGPPERKWGLTNSDGRTITRMTRFGLAKIYFDESALSTMETRFAWTVAICLLGVLSGAVLLGLYLPRITNPIEQMLA